MCWTPCGCSTGCCGMSNPTIERESRREMKHRTWILWGVALFITVGTAVYQRVTGPTYPLRGEVMLGNERVGYVLKRSEEQKNAVVEIPVGDSLSSGKIEWRRHLAGDPWSAAPMVNSEVNGHRLMRGELPAQPPAGKLDYQIILEKKGAIARIPAGDP